MIGQETSILKDLAIPGPKPHRNGHPAPFVTPKMYLQNIRTSVFFFGFSQLIHLRKKTTNAPVSVNTGNQLYLGWVFKTTKSTSIFPRLSSSSYLSNTGHVPQGPWLTDGRKSMYYWGRFRLSVKSWFGDKKVVGGSHVVELAGRQLQYLLCKDYSGFISLI